MALSISARTHHPEETEKFVSYMTLSKAMQTYYNVYDSPVTVK